MRTSDPSNLHEPTREGRILVVDLEPDVGRLIRWILAEEGLAVETVSSPPAALEAVAQARPALVLLSPPAGLPRRTVAGFATELQRAGGPVPLLLLDRAGWTPEEVRQVGAVGVLPKPFKGMASVEAVWRALSPAPRG